MHESYPASAGDFNANHVVNCNDTTLDGAIYIVNIPMDYGNINARNTDSCQKRYEAAPTSVSEVLKS
jgi:hypothetical protein